MAKYRTPKSIRRRRRQRRNEYWMANGAGWQGNFRRRRRRVRRSILDLIFLPPFLIMEELIERCREVLNVK